ncbi:hypothetical protein GCM10025876_39420 [Demequina litorisediminis]|uniref:Uncharacterized protein n=1 Tax=Demequina litorisediminis TaxID=1849022 RepID=A0ABQ6IKQ6_9MICO|nr:hypothetical protein GCM10025876_39420 [Demequina litorisediminis]
MAVEHAACRLVRLGAQHQVGARLRTAQVDVAVLEASLLADGDVLIHGHRQRRGLVEDGHLGDDHLNLTGREVGVRGTCGALAHFARHLQDVLVAEAVGHLLADDDLGETRGVTQINERHAAVIAATPDPSGQSDGGARVGGAEVSCEVGAKHDQPFWAR